ncbi:hypothetical protein VTI28DRAFT_9459 [Corynascus sepedonium]
MVANRTLSHSITRQLVPSGLAAVQNPLTGHFSLRAGGGQALISLQYQTSQGTTPLLAVLSKTP